MKDVVAHEEESRRTYLRIGGDVFAVYGDRWRGFSPIAQDIGELGAESLNVYGSLDELYFALVNLCVARAGQG